MNDFKEIKPNEINKNVFDMIGKDWMLIAAESGGKANAMTASWGGLGVIWNKNAAYLFIRPQRYTKELIDGSDMLSLSFYDEKFRDKLNYFGSVSGRNEDKIQKSGLTKFYYNGVPCFEEANIVMICRKLFAQEINPECFIDKNIERENYPNKDYHAMYVVEITKVLVRE